MTRAILTDIEGTTTALSFVKDVLFPYSRQHMPEFVIAHGDQPEVAALLEQAREIVGQPLDREGIVAQLQHWIDEDRKITPLKTLQGMQWQEGYRRGQLQGHLYEDAQRSLRRWHDLGIRLYVYSSGSVQAQRLLFAHTQWGDLTPLFSGFFDTHVGPKREADSYRRIAQQIELPPGEILFLSDVEAELDAAAEAGMQTRWLVREDSGHLGARHRIARDFDDIEIAGS